MKDITITVKRIKKEIIFLLSSFITAFLLNAHAIYKYESPWSELFSQIHIIVIITIIIYVLLLFIREIINIAVKIFKLAGK